MQMPDVFFAALRLCARSSPLIAALGLGAACDLVDQARTVVVPAESEVTIPGSAGIGGNPLAPEDVIPADFGALLSQQVEQQISTEGVPKDAVDSMKVTSFTLEVTNPDEQGGRQIKNLGFLDSVAFSLGAGDVEPKLVAQSVEGDFDDDTLFVELSLTDAELVDVLNAGDEMGMTADVATNSRPDFDTTIRFAAEVTVLVDPVGAASAAEAGE